MIGNAFVEHKVTVKYSTYIATTIIWDISLASKLTGKWLEGLSRCCFVPMIINPVLPEFSKVT